MARPQLGISIPELPQVQRRLAKLREGIEPKEILQPVGKYLISEKALGHYPPRKSITRKAAYGVSFFSEKQRRWFFAVGIHRTPHKRTMALRKGWRMLISDDDMFLINLADGARWVIGTDTQSRHERMVGWRTVKDSLKQASRKIDSILSGAVKRAMRKAGYR